MIGMTKYLLLGLLTLGLALGPLFGDGEGDGGRDGGIVVLPQAVSVFDSFRPSVRSASTDAGVSVQRSPRLTHCFEPGKAIRIQLPQSLSDALVLVDLQGETYSVGRVDGRRLAIAPAILEQLHQAGVRELTLRLYGPEFDSLELRIGFDDDGCVKLIVF